MELVKKLILISIFLLVIPYVSAKSESSCSVTSRGLKTASFWPECIASDGNQPTVPGETGCMGGACVEACSDQWHLYFECYCEPGNPFCVHDNNVDCGMVCGYPESRPPGLESTCEEMLMNSSFYNPGNLVEMGYCECCKASDPPFGTSPRNNGQIRGNDPFWRGVTYCRGGGLCTDWCMTERVLSECYCEGYDPYCKHTEIDCMSLLGPSGRCMDGECVLVEECYATDPPPPPTYPQGNDPFIQGITTCRGGTCSDWCNDYSWLEECYCSSPASFCEHDYINCYSQYNKVCFGGACRDPICTATDPPDIPNYPQGDDPFIGGTIYCNNGFFDEDSCLDSVTLQECFVNTPDEYPLCLTPTSCNSLCSPKSGQCRTNANGEGYCYCYSFRGGCPTLFVHDGKEYKKERISNIHSEEGIDTVDEIELTVKPIIVDGYYQLMLREQFFPGHSHIDSVNLFVDGEEAKLISAIHSKYGDVTSILGKSDDIRTDTKLWDEIELKFEAGKAESFVFKIEGYNPALFKTPIGVTPAELSVIVITTVAVIIVVIFGIMKFFAKKR